MDTAPSIPCPHCHRALARRIPDEAESIGCPQCGHVFEPATNWTLPEAWKSEPFTPPLPLGATGELSGVRWTVVGATRVSFDGSRAVSTHHLLHEEREGFRWLVEQSNTWCQLGSIDPKRVDATQFPRVVRCEGLSFTWRPLRFATGFDDALGFTMGGELPLLAHGTGARVNAVQGEFPRKVLPGTFYRFVELAYGPHSVLCRTTDGEPEPSWFVLEPVDLWTVSDSFAAPQLRPAGWLPPPRR